MEYPDISWAASAYDNREGATHATDYTSGSMSFQANATCAIVTFGYDRYGNSSGVIDKKFFSTATNSVLSSPPPAFRSAASGEKAVMSDRSILDSQSFKIIVK
jgi:hypothetical protein